MKLNVEITLTEALVLLESLLNHEAKEAELPTKEEADESEPATEIPPVPIYGEGPFCPP